MLLTILTSGTTAKYKKGMTCKRPGPLNYMTWFSIVQKGWKFKVYLGHLQIITKAPMVLCNS